MMGSPKDTQKDKDAWLKEISPLTEQKSYLDKGRGMLIPLFIYFFNCNSVVWYLIGPFLQQCIKFPSIKTT